MELQHASGTQGELEKSCNSSMKWTLQDVFAVLRQHGRPYQTSDDPALPNVGPWQGRVAVTQPEMLVLPCCHSIHVTRFGLGS